ncbi:glycosyltransferase family 25 protein [Vibrio celticus]|uniref:Glycosyltransferase family 25 (LPS biosynthesis protein) n=1 Tax=Vibrio celticus TaxID=446372 RepID=A0A1C3JC25_9VIBR|nr:glycosyltransferase family 25 protein [Vibrio celticus]SBT12667.1 Glycosyltransferase family 25 (LPS biosynthesis protein) [Vibrio celticus]
MKVVVINLKRSINRRRRIEASLKNIGIKFDFLEGVDSSEPNFRYSERRNEALTRKRFGYNLVENEIACFSSHHLAWEKCLEINEPILVLEDNCDLSSDFSNHFLHFNKLSRDYDFIKLAATKPKSFKIIKKIDNSLSIVRYHKRTCGIMGYIITPGAAEKFIKNAQTFVEPVDNYMEKPYKHGVSTYVFKPDLVRRADIPSTIGSSRKEKIGLTIWNKIYIEAFRIYEQIKDSQIKHPD